jgi:hypothetical protein
LPDRVTSLAYGYGIFWYEQKKDAQGNRTWVKYLIDNAWSQAHALTIADLKVFLFENLTKGRSAPEMGDRSATP